MFQKVEGRLPRIHWCPTGSLMQLPLHAAGKYKDHSALDQHTYDFVISSYTPSLSALRRSFDGLATQRSTPHLLVVTQPATPGQSPLPGTADEGTRLAKIFSMPHFSSNALDHKHATADAVLRAISEHSWVHFACHGSQNSIDATRSAFSLYDGVS